MSISSKGQTSSSAASTLSSSKDPINTDAASITAPALSASIVPPPPTPGPLRRADRWVREHSLLLLLITMVSAFAWPQVASKVLARGVALRVPMTSWHYDVQSLALAIIIFATAIRCTPRDFVRVFGSKAGTGFLFAVYGLVPAVALGAAFGVLKIAGAGDLRGVAYGLVLLVVVPVSTTSAIWTRSSQGSVPLSLGMIALTSVGSILLVPTIMTRLAGVTGVDLHSSINGIRMNVLFAFAVPLIIGTSIRTIAPKLAQAVEPLVSLAAMIVLLAFVGNIVAALRPHIVSNTALLAIALPVTVIANIFAFTSGWVVAKVRKLSDEETVALVYGSGMRSTLTAVVLAAICFPGDPIVALPPILWTLAQQIGAGFLTLRFLKVRDSAEPVLPLKRRIAQAAARASRPALEEIDALLEDTLVMAPRSQRSPSRHG